MAVEDIDADMLVVQERVSGGEQKHRRKQVPLQFEPGVRAHIERVADHRIAGADDNRGQHQPIDEVPDLLVQPVDRAAQA